MQCVRRRENKIRLDAVHNQKYKVSKINAKYEEEDIIEILNVVEKCLKFNAHETGKISLKINLLT